MPRPFSFSLCADDYAMAPGVSRGIIEALDAGALGATSVMTTSPSWPDDAPALSRYADKADIGLHLNLTLGAPLAPMPLLAPDGRLPSVRALMRSARQGTLPLDEIAAEIDRQSDRFLAVFGRAPDHVDGHQHVQMLAPVRALVFATLARRGWTPWLRDSADRPWRIIDRGQTIVKAMGLAVLGRGFRRQADAAGFTTNEGFSGFSSFDRRTPYRLAFDHYLKSPGRRHLVMCHPGYVDDTLRALDPVVDTREDELAFLLSPDFRLSLQCAGATLERLSAMPPTG